MKVFLSLRMRSVSRDVVVVGFSDCFFTGEYTYVTGFEKTQLPYTIINYKYLEILILIIWSILRNSGREADACMKFVMVL